MDERASAGNHSVLVPIVHSGEFAELLAVADVPHEPLARQTGPLHYLAAPRQDTERSVFGIELTGPVSRRGPEIGLRTSRHPVKIHRSNIRSDTVRDVRQPWQTRLATVLEAAASAALDLDLELEGEVLSL